MANPNTNSRFPNSKQIPDHAIVDFYNKQAYLGQQFIGSSGLITLADTSEHPILYLANPATATLSLFNYVRKLCAGDLTNSVVFKIYGNPTSVTSGSVITPANCRLSSNTASIATCKSSVSAGGNGTLIETLPVGLGFSPIDESTILILDPGASILITAKGSAATTCVASAIWYEL